MTLRLDILFVADVRFEGGTSTALAVEIRAAARAGLRAGLLAVKGPLLGLPFPMHPDLRALVDDGAVERVDPDMPVETGLVLVHHPTILANRPNRPLAVRTRRLALVLHHPMVDRGGRRQYDVERVALHCHDAFRARVALAPVSDVVRRSLPRDLPPFADLLDEDWTNLIDPDDWPARPPRPVGQPIVIGRHARPDPLKWPSAPIDATRVYPPDGERYRIRILGGGPFLEELYGPLPRNWEQLPFSWTGVPEFLAGLDFYVYFHSDSWSEAFGRTILEALLVGLVAVLPPHFEGLFGEAAVYATPREVERVVARFAGDAEAYAAQAARARAFALAHCSIDLFPGRLERLASWFRRTNPVAEQETRHWADGPAGTVGAGTHAAAAAPASEPAGFAPALPVRNVLFASSNGIGVGHVAQQLAIARRLPLGLRPVFATMSYSMKVAVDEGYQAHFLTYHRHIGADPDDWNRVLAEELFDLVGMLRPRVFAYDATAVFDGVARALAMHPDLFSIWVRRPMWREAHRPFLDYAAGFDAVIEPGELAEEFDHGPTRALRDQVLLVPPVLHLGPDERLDADTARKALDLPEGLTVVALQLGAGTNFDMRPVRRALIDAILARPDTFVLDIRSPIAAEFGPEEPAGPRHRIAALFPSFRYSRAFDAAVSAAGYNAFHENVLGAVPTLFVPNEADEMDVQLSRARWAEITGRGWLMRRDHDLAFVEAHVERLLDPAARADIAERCRAIAWTNGAEAIARYIEDHARIVRTDRDAAKPV